MGNKHLFQYQEIGNDTPKRDFNTTPRSSPSPYTNNKSTLHRPPLAPNTVTSPTIIQQQQMQQQMQHDTNNAWAFDAFGISSKEIDDEVSFAINELSITIPELNSYFF